MQRNQILFVLNKNNESLRKSNQIYSIPKQFLGYERDQMKDIKKQLSTTTQDALHSPRIFKYTEQVLIFGFKTILKYRLSTVDTDT